MPLPSTEVNQSIFRGFSDPDMSDEESGEEIGWEVAPGAFPSSARSHQMEEDHVFSDEPYDGSPYYSLKVVKEGSKEETQTGASSPRQDDIMAVSVASSDTPAISNLADSAALKADATAMKTSKKKSPTSGGAPIQQNSSLSSTGFYPYNIYQSLSKQEKKKEREEQMLNDSRVTASTMSSRSSRKGDRDYSSAPTPPNVSMMEDQESASYMSDQHSSHVLDTSNSIQPPYSVVSARSRGTKAGKSRYLVRHTLATSQQVNANPATMLKNLFIGIEQERHMHKLTSENLRAVNNWLLFLPAILLTLLSGVVALVFEAELNTRTDLTVYSSIFVGVGALVSVFWQALAKQLDFGTRATLHDITAASLKRLSEDIPLTLASTDSIPAEYVAMIGEKLAQATDSCPSTIPHKLEAAFATVSDRMVLMLRPPMGQAPRKHVQKIDFMNLYATAYDELTTEIIHYWAWPFAFPQPRDASDAALENFKAIVIEGRERNNKSRGLLRRLFPCCIGNKLGRSLFDVVPAASVGDSSNYQNSKQQSPAADYPIRHSMLGNEI